MSISCSGSERESASSSLIVWREDGRETAVKENDSDMWSSDGLVLWLGSKQNGDAVEWWREWSRLR
jgi:hypothetical protein